MPTEYPELARFAERFPSDSLLARSLGPSGGLALRIEGELEGSNSSLFLELASGVVEDRPPGSRVILDLGGLRYVSSTGVGAFTTLLVAAQRRGVDLVLADVPASVRSVLDLLGFSAFFRTVELKEAADGGQRG